MKRPNGWTIREYRLYRRVGWNIRNTREIRGISQTQLGKMVGLTRTSITNIEAGRQRILLDRLLLIGTALRHSACEWIAL